MTNRLADSAEALRKLRVNQNSPHKPIMLLSVLQLFEEGRIIDNKISYNQELLDTFRSLF